MNFEFHIPVYIEDVDGTIRKTTEAERKMSVYIYTMIENIFNDNRKIRLQEA